MSISFKGAHFPKDVILHADFFYWRYGVSDRDLEEIMAERGVTVDHTTLNRWVERYDGQVAEEARRRKRPTDRSWRMDETYIKVRRMGLSLPGRRQVRKDAGLPAIKAPEQAGRH